MTPYQQRLLSGLIRRLAEDLKIRNRAQATIDAYTFHVARFETFLQRTTGRPLKQASPEDVRAFQLHLLNTQKVGYSSFNQAVCGLRFFYRFTCPRRWPVTMLPFGKRPKTLPVVLGHPEVESLLRCTPNLKHRTFLMTLYASGIRIAEASRLTAANIDSRRMQLQVTGKGNKQRQVPLSPRLLEQLRQYWKAFRPPDYLFPGKTPRTPYQPATIQKAIKRSAGRAGIGKNVTPHTLRHSYATGLLEAGVDLLTISRLLGHASFTTTMVYLHVRRTHLQSTPSPLDLLPVRQLPTWQQAEGTPDQQHPKNPAQE